MATPQITLYAFDYPDRSQPQAVFSVNVGNFLPYFGAIGPEYNAMATWVNDQVVYIDSAILDGQTAIDASVSEAAASAAESAASASISQAAANMAGNWVDLTGALNKPASVYHSGKYWALLNDLADVTLSEPGVTADWAEIGLSLETVNITGNFTAEAGVSYNVTTADITMPALAVGEIYTFHAITDNVRILNPSYTLKNGTRSISAGDDLLLRNGQTVKLTAISITELEVI